MGEQEEKEEKEERWNKVQFATRWIWLTAPKARLWTQQLVGLVLSFVLSFVLSPVLSPLLILFSALKLCCTKRYKIIFIIRNTSYLFHLHTPIICYMSRTNSSLCVLRWPPTHEHNKDPSSFISFDLPKKHRINIQAGCWWHDWWLLMPLEASDHLW